MNIEKFNKWLYEEKRADKTFYVLIGPPAVGKTTWVEQHVKGDTVVVSKDDIIENVIFPKYNLANKDIFQLPSEDMPVGSEHPEKKKLGKVISYKRFSKSKNKEVEEKAFENAFAAGEELNLIYDSKIKDAISSGAKNIIIDAIHMLRSTRGATLDYVRENKDYKIVGVIFPFQGYEKQIKKSADARAKDFLEKFGPEFDRGVSWKQYDQMFQKYEPPSLSEGFDDLVQAQSRFKEKDVEDGETLNEKIVRNTRELFAESREDLSRYWNHRADSRSKNARREAGNEIDLEWARLQQEKSRKINSKIHKIFERDIQASDEVLSEVEKLLEKIKKEREELKRKIQEKKKAQFLSPRDERPKGKLGNPYKDAKVTGKYPYSKDRTGGVAKVFKRRSKQSGGPALAPGESFGPLGENNDPLSSMNDVQRHNFFILIGDTEGESLGDRLYGTPVKQSKNMMVEFGLSIEDIVKFITECKVTKDTKITKTVTFGTRGFIYELENDHIFKIFIGDYSQASGDDIDWYNSLDEKLFSSTGSVNTLKTYVQGRIRLSHITVKYAEMSKLIPLHDFIRDTGRNQADAQEDFEWAKNVLYTMKYIYKDYKLTDKRGNLKDDKFESFFIEALSNSRLSTNTKVGYEPLALTKAEMIQIAKCMWYFKKQGYDLHDTHIGNIGMLPQSDKSKPNFVIFDN